MVVGMIMISIISRNSNSGIIDGKREYLFVGFNVLSNSEKKIIKYFIKEKKSMVFWDFDSYYFNDQKQEAGDAFRDFSNDKILNSTFPKIIPDKVARKPMLKPVKKKDFFIEVLFKPKVFKIAISLVLFFINIVRPEIILNAATIIIKVRIINITFLSTFKALKKDLFKSDQV